MSSEERPNWQCEFQKVREGPELHELTVGAKFLMKCSGSEIEAWREIPELKFER